MMNDERAIRDVIATWHRATAAGDLPTVLPVMDEDKPIGSVIILFVRSICSWRYLKSPK